MGIGHDETIKCLFGFCERVRDIRRVCSMSQRRPFIQKNLWKWLDCVHKLGGQGLRESGQTSSISQAEGDADMVAACICILMGGSGVQQETNGFC